MPDPISTIMRLSLTRQLIEPDPELLADARSWLMDCVWLDVESEDIAEMSARQILLAVNRHFEGGWINFVAASGKEVA